MATKATKNLIWKTGTGWTENGSTATTNITALSTTVTIGKAGVKLDASKATDAIFDMTANSTNATLLGGAGGDILATSASNTVWFNGGAGDDTITGGKGADTFELKGAFGTDTLKSVGLNAIQDVIKIGSTFSSLSFSDFANKTLTMSVAGLGDAKVGYYSANAASIAKAASFMTTDKTFSAQFAAAATTFTSVGATTSEYVRQFSAGISEFVGFGKGDTLIGGTGNDIFAYNKDIAVINGGSGNDTVKLSGATAQTLDLTTAQFTAIEVVSGTSATGALTLRGIANADTLLGGGAADSIWSRGGNDSMDGGAGADTFWFVAGDGVDTIAGLGNGGTKDTVKFYQLNQADLSFAWDTAGTGSVVATYGTSGSDIVFMKGASGIVNVQTTDKTFGLVAKYSDYTANTNLAGSIGADYIRSFFTTEVSAGSVMTINGGGGADTIVGGAGKDNIVFNSALAYVDGGAGIDTLGSASSVSALTIDLFNDSAKFLNIEYVQGGVGNDVLRGYNSAAETLSGDVGADALWSAGGNDSMDGGIGNDTYWFAAGDGNDTLNAGNTNSDVYKFAGLKFSDLSFAKDVDVNTTLKVTYGSDTVTMTSYNNADSTKQSFQTSDATFHLITDLTAGTLNGTVSTDLVKMFGETGVYINAKGGADTIYGGAGDDTIAFYNDLVSVDGGAGTNSLQAVAGTYTPLTIDLNQAKYTNIQQVVGGEGNDIIRGTVGAQTLTGGAGNDALWGAAGDDQMTGGAGVDTYWFTAGDGTDTITGPTGSNDALDVVKFYSVAGTANVTATMDGSDLNLALADGSKLVLQSWSGTNKINKFTFDSGTYKLSDDAATWTKL